MKLLILRLDGPFAIARQLRISRSTVQRHVQDLMELLGARTRFQAAVQASRRGWL